MLAAAGLGAALTAFGFALLYLSVCDPIGWVAVYFGATMLLCAGAFGLKIRKQA